MQYSTTVHLSFSAIVVLHYIGPGKKNTGDWCFADGFITFKDIKEAYMECFRSNAWRSLATAATLEDGYLTAETSSMQMG